MPNEPKNVKKKKKWHTKKKYTRAFRDLKRRPEIHREVELRAEPPNVLNMKAQTDMYLYVQIDYLDRSNYFATKNENSTPCRDTTRAWPRPPPAEAGEASKMRHAEQAAHREVDLIASMVVYGSRTWSKMT